MGNGSGPGGMNLQPINTVVVPADAALRLTLPTAGSRLPRAHVDVFPSHAR